MELNQHYSARQTPTTLHIELTAATVHLLGVLGDAIAAKAMIKSFTQTHNGFRFAWFDEEHKQDQVAQILQLIGLIDLEQLAEAALEKTRAVEERNKFLELPIQELGAFLSTHSAGRLNSSDTDKFTLRLRPTSLLPVTHFKRFASLGSWNVKSQVFEYSAPYSDRFKDQLLRAVTALAKSKKNVSEADIIERRKVVSERKKAKAAKLNRALEIEEMDFGDYAGNFGTHAALMREEEGGFKRFERRARDD
jgi:hypothetical protein